MGEQAKLVMHVDCDCFFAAVEMREAPELKARPLAIGADRDQRGIVTTCNYPARKFGIRSAMPVAHARQLCPDLLMIPPRMALYRQVSAEVMAILRGYSSCLEVVSIDEAYLTIDPSLDIDTVANTIRLHIQQQIGITVSIGIADCKFLAKVASDWHKPNGQFHLLARDKEAFLKKLPVASIPGVGPAFQKQLRQINIETCDHAQAWSLAELVKRYGRSGAMLYQRCRGLDSRPLVEYRERKSISTEKTFSHDLTDATACLKVLPDLYEAWCLRVRKANLTDEVLQPFVKIKFKDFSQTTVSDQTVSTTLEGFQQLMQQALNRSDLPVRLLGIGGRRSPVGDRQLSLFNDHAPQVETSDLNQQVDSRHQKLSV